MKKGGTQSEETKAKISQSMLSNKNAEKMTEQECIDIMNTAIELARTSQETDEKGVTSYKYDFIGEVCNDLGITRHHISHWGERFKSIVELKKTLKAILESNCYDNTKKGRINTAVGIINLKSNHQWTDRIVEKQEGEVNQNINITTNVKMPGKE